MKRNAEVLVIVLLPAKMRNIGAQRITCLKIDKNIVIFQQFNKRLFVWASCRFDQLRS